jgi:hypothetical protein
MLAALEFPAQDINSDSHYGAWEPDNCPRERLALVESAQESEFALAPNGQCFNGKAVVSTLSSDRRAPLARCGFYSLNESQNPLTAGAVECI